MLDYTQDMTEVERLLASCIYCPRLNFCQGLVKKEDKKLNGVNHRKTASRYLLNKSVSKSQISYFYSGDTQFAS